jgi:2-polyprenyl-6-methoxyphenol hydroxylase-like FAD-dependent oxidoreductase
VRSRHMADYDYDVAIVGGGLAGLTLAAQLSREDPGCSVAILERNEFPPPAAAHKVGESTVEIGAHYLAEVLGLGEHLEQTQIRKFGLRLFFGSGHQDDLSAADELGASRILPARSYQVDRGRLEGDIAGMLREQGVSIHENCVVRNIDVSDNGDGHTARVTTDGEPQSIRCRWIVDASSRAAMVKRSMNVAKPSDHKIASAWFRLDKKIAVDDWSQSIDWQQRCDRPRFLSTNHLMGSGYWVWIIPLVDDRTSIGLVADPEIHPLSSFSSFDRLTGWLAEHQGVLAERIAGEGGSLMDFRFSRNLAKDADKVWSENRWALTGEAGVFTDPFYSPGSDFIGISNTFIADLVRRDRRGENCAARATIYNKVYKSFFASTMSLYENQYPGFGDFRLMAVKTTWDYAYYWSVLSWLFYRGMLTDLGFLQGGQARLVEMRALNDTMQAAFRKRASHRRTSEGAGRFVDQVAIPILYDLNAALLEVPGDPGAELDENCDRLAALAPILLSMLEHEHAAQHNVCSLTGDLAHRLN